MSSSVIELKPNQKLSIELNEKINLDDLAVKLKDYINVVHIYHDNDYKKVNIFRDGSTDTPRFLLDKSTKIILENTDKDIRFTLNLDFTLCEEEKDEKEDEKDLLSRFLKSNEKSTEANHWSNDSIKTVNIPYEKQGFNLKFKEIGVKYMPNDGFLKLVEECAANSTTGNISFRFFFMEGKNFLKLFHFQMFLILKKFMEKLIIGHNQFQGNHYLLDIFVFVCDMKDDQLGSAMIHKYVKNEENNVILPTKAVLKLNHKKISNKRNDKINIRLMLTLFHELAHCLGFGYWDLFGKNLCYSKINSSNDASITADNVLNIQKTNSYYKSYFKNEFILGIPMTNDRTHYNIYNVAVTKNGKLFSVLPGLKYELMSNNETDVNVFTKISASILEALGYHINYKLCDEYPYINLPETMTVEYGKVSANHFANGVEKYIVLLKHKNLTISGNETFSMKENVEYRIKNNHSYSLFVVSALEEDERYLLTEKDGVSYSANELIIRPNSKTPDMFFIVSSITFGGIPVVKQTSLSEISLENCYNKSSLKNMITEFVNGKAIKSD